MHITWNYPFISIKLLNSYFFCPNDFQAFLKILAYIEPEPLPTFSICSEPPFDSEYLKTNLSVSPNFFYAKEFLKTLEGEHYEFPSNLSEDLHSNHSLNSFWKQSVLSPIAFVIGEGENADMIVRDQNYNGDGNLTGVIFKEIIKI